MHLIITGASGYLATEVIRQALSHPKITTVVALARKKVKAPTGLRDDADVSKLRSLVVGDYDAYSEDVRREFGRVGACIWYVNISLH